MTEVGHNSGAVDAVELSAIVERIEALELKKTHLADDIKEIYKEAGSKGFEPAVLKEVISLRKKGPKKSQTSMVRVYMRALGQGELFDI